MKPMLAEDWNEQKVIEYFNKGGSLIAQPKVDGVRGLNMLGSLTGRSLKAHKNKYTTKFYSHSSLIGLDGELAAAWECDPDLCRKTSSALSTIEGEPYTLWWLFDYVTPQTRLLGYKDRYEALTERIRELYHINNQVWQHLRIVPSVLCHNIEELLACDAKWLDMGFEGTCIRDPNGLHKQGRSTVREMGLLRIKRFIQSEALITGITEGETNLNDAQINELGKTFRTSHKDGKIPNGMVGSMQAKQIGDVYDPSRPGVKILEDGQDITISTGSLTEEECKFYFENPGQIISRISKYNFFPKGMKDKPRFPNHQSFKIESDI